MDHQFIAGREVFSTSSEVVAEWLQRREAEASGLELRHGRGIDLEPLT